MKEALKKFNSLIKNGYVPCRFMQEYTEKNCRLANCFIHSCFNFTNSILEEISPNDAFKVSTLSRGTKKDTVELLNNFLMSSGLIVKPCRFDAKPNSDEWKVAYLFTDKYNFILGDYHVLLQEKDGSWSSKNGFSRKVDFLENIKEVSACGYNYKFHSTFLIKNPTAELNK